MEQRWRCKVCGYVHRGDAPPDICPVCGVGVDKFTVMDDGAEPSSLPEKVGLLQEMAESFKPHPVMAHFPNALLPTLGLFLLLSLLGVAELDHGIYLLLGVVALSTIMTFATGIYSWRKHYASAKTHIFQRKLMFGGCLVLVCGEMLLLRFNNPDLLASVSVTSLFFFALAATALICVTMLGHYGGMLVFGRD